MLGKGLLVAICVVSLLGCAAGNVAGTDQGQGASAAGGPGAGGAGASSSSDSGGFGVGASGGQAPQEVLLYAHTDDTLYSLDPKGMLSLQPVGSFDCVGGDNQDKAMTDLAVGGDGALFGISQSFVWTLDLASCGTSVTLDNPKDVRFYGLTFAPAGLLHPDKEVLIGGNTAGELWAIDDQGLLSQRGNFGKVPADDGNGNSYEHAGKAWELSGDIVFVEGDTSPLGFATVRDCPNPPYTSGCNPINTLIEIDVAKIASATTQTVTKSVRGQIRKAADCSDGTDGDYGNMYGIAAWSDKVYGFSRSGNIVQIDTSDGGGCLVEAFAELKFAGAGMTTKAELVPPKPK